MFTEVLVVVAVVFILLYFSTTFFNTSSPEISEVPFFPGRLPILGHSWKMNMCQPHITLARWAKAFGPMFRIQLYGEDILVLNDYKSIYEALVISGTAVSGRPPMYRTLQDDRHKHSIVWQTYNAKLVFLRKEVLRSLKMYGKGLGELEVKCISEIKELLENFRKVESKAIDPWSIIYDSVCRIMLNLILGSNERDGVNTRSERIKEMNTMFNETFGSGESRQMDFLPWLRQHWSSHKQKLQRALHLRDDIWKNDIMPSLGSSSVIRHLLSLVGNTDDNDVQISEDTAKEVFTNLVLAGTDTTATALTSLLLIFLNHVDVQQKMYEEISSTIGTNVAPKLCDRNSLPYCEAVLLELLRYISHIPLAVPHYTMHETSICEKTISGDLTVYMNLWALHHDEDIWKDPWDFNPGRFLDEHGRLLSPGHQIRRRLMIFGAGRRVCLGETLAKNRLFLFATSLVQKLEFLPENPLTLPSCDPRTFVMGLVLHPKSFHLVVRCRRSEQTI